MDGVCLVGLGRIQPLHDHGEQRHDLPVRCIFREPPADADLAVLQASVPSRGRARFISLISATTTGVTAKTSWTWRQGGSCTRATSLGTIRENR